MASVAIAEAVAFYASITSGNAGLICDDDREPADTFAGNVSYVATTGPFAGWRLTVFNDCNSFDYVDEIVAPDGRSIGFDDLAGTDADYRPSDHAVSFRLFGIPGGRVRWTGWRPREAPLRLGDE